jgi:hypothetical protein
MMTFTIALVNQHGVWQSADMRLTDLKTHELRDDYSMKHVRFRCPDGAALLTYTGVGSVNGVHLSDWLHQFSRDSDGITYTLKELLVQIRLQSTKELGELLFKRQLPHMFSVGSFMAGLPCLTLIRNFSTEHGTGSILREFNSASYSMSRGPEATGSILFPWPREFISQSDLNMLTELSTGPLREPKEISDLLASVNLRTAAAPRSNGLVSPHCVTSYMPSSGDCVQMRLHNPPAASVELDRFIARYTR